jgi:hypothetical protein
VFYVLDEKGEPVQVDAFPVGFFEGDDHRRVAYTERRNINVSTIFLSLDHNFRGEGPPILFETMSFPDEEQERYSTLKEAIEGHRRHVKRVFKRRVPETEWGSVVIRNREGELRKVGVSVWERLAGPDWI